MITVGYLGVAERPDKFYKMLLGLAGLHGQKLFYFSRSDVNIATREINAWLYDSKKMIYYRQIVPYPDIIEISRLYTSDSDLDLMRSLGEVSVLSKTCNFIGKMKFWEIFQNPNLKKYSIETCKYENADIEVLLDKHKTLMLKPDKSSGGKGCCTLSRKDDKYHLLFFNAKEEILKKKDFYKTYNGFFSEQGYIVQPFHNFKTSTNNSYDIRYNLHRGRNGKWGPFGTFIRVGSEGSVVSNLHSGGFIVAEGLIPFLNTYVGDGKSILDEISTVAQILGPVVQEKYKKHTVCLIAFDIGVDRDNNNELKIIEINSSPVKLNHLKPELAIKKVYYWTFLHKRRDWLLKKQKNLYSDKKSAIS